MTCISGFRRPAGKNRSQNRENGPVSVENVAQGRDSGNSSMTIVTTCLTAGHYTDVTFLLGYIFGNGDDTI